MDGCPDKVLPMKRQSKLAKALEEHSDWCSIMGVRGIGKLNAKVLSGDVIDLINLSEALHERKYADIADQIYARRGTAKIVFIAGPSSSGKTSTSKRLALQCRIWIITLWTESSPQETKTESTTSNASEPWTSSFLVSSSTNC